MVNKFFISSSVSYATTKRVSVNRQNGELNIRLGSGRDFGINELSSGEKLIVGLFVHLCFIVDIQKSQVFMIDEPELSLHLIWQEELLNSFKEINKKLQFLIATHSPAILSNVKGVNIHNLSTKDLSQEY